MDAKEGCGWRSAVLVKCSSAACVEEISSRSRVVA